MEQRKNLNVFELWETKVFPLLKRIRRFFYVPIVLGASVFALIYFGEAKKSAVYTAKITFMLEDDILNESQKMAPGNQLLIALSGQSAQSNKAILVDLGVSNKLVEMTLLSKAKIAEKETLLANYYMDKMGFRTQWKKEGNQKLAALEYAADYKIGSDQEKDLWLRYFSNQIKINLKPSLQESGLIVMTYSSEDELFTKLFCENHLQTISEFYINKKVERSYNLVQLTRRKRDSLLAVLTGKTYTLANIQDKGIGTVMRRAHVPEIQMNRDIGIVNQQYIESVTALSAATLDLERKKPFISVVDDVRLPLDAVFPNPTKKALGLSIFSVILGFAAIVGVMLGLDLLNSQKKDFQKARNS